MIVFSTTRRRKNDSGIALLISIFVLLLVCVVGIAMMVASGTETSLTGNYYSSTSAYYASLAGLEEGRGRLLPKNVAYLGSIAGLNYLPTDNTDVSLGDVVYILNPLDGETVDPTDSSSIYYDNEYQNEFGGAPANIKTTLSTSNLSSPFNLSGFQGPPYKWVRINPVTEFALGIDVNGGGSLNTTDPIHFNGTQLCRGSCEQGFKNQVFEITALSVLSNKSQRLMQYIVAPDSLNLNFYSTLTIPGSGIVFSPATYHPSSPFGSFHIHGEDQFSSGHPAPCSSTPQSSIPAVGTINSADDTAVMTAQNNTTRPWRFSGAGSGTNPPSHQNVNYVGGMPTNMQTPADLEQLIQAIRQSADVTLTGPVTQMDMPAAMSASNPMTVFVGGDPTVPSQGNLSLNGGFTGYGMLVVTGSLTYTDSTSWNGIILVIGQGVVNETSGGGNGEIDGAFLIANTRDSSGNILLTLGPASFTAASPDSDGIYYNSCWVKKAQKPVTYKTISFREIQQ